MPQDAWRRLIEYLMAEKGVKNKTQLAKALGICARTVARWLGEKPAMPEVKSIEGVAAWSGMSVLELRKMWTRFMMEQNGIFETAPELAGEIAEEPGVYGQARDYLAESGALEDLDMRNVPIDIVPALRQERAEIVEDVEQTVTRLGKRINGFRRVYAGAVDTALRTQLPVVR
ncbi:MAG: helix-turn-helix domain-containing protein [bacterium]|nr:helix-turn-helix domain-containing protein [bacterium]